MSTPYNELAIEVTPSGNITLILKEGTSWRKNVRTKRFSLPRRRFERALRDAKITVPWQATQTSPTHCECGHIATQHYSHGGCGYDDGVRCDCLNFTARAVLSA